MAHIKSRKHPVLASRLTAPAAAALAVMGLHSAVVAQQQPADAPKAETLPAVKAKAKAENDYKATVSSSPKFTQPLVDTPQTITVIKKELLRDQGSSSLSEALSNTPGVTFTMGENGNTTTGDSIFLRGFDTSGNIFVDGIRDLGTITRDTFNIEQIEVVKGPSGSDNGRGSPSGYINLSSKVPTLEDFSNGNVRVSSGNRVRLAADLNRSLESVAPGTAFRFNAMTDRGDKLGRDVAENKRWGIAPSLALGLGTPTRAYFNYLHIKQENIPDGGIPAIGLSGFSTPGARVDRSNFYGSTSDFDNIEADMFTARFEHDLRPGTTLRNTTRYGRTTQQYVLTGINAINSAPSVANPFIVAADPGTWTVNRSRQGKDQENEILTNQTNLTTNFDTAGLKHSLSTGIEFIHERQSNVGFVATGTTDTANLYNPSTSDQFGAVVPSGAYTKGNTTTVALYAFDTLEVTPQWKINGGVRWEKYKTEFISIPAAAAASQTATNLGRADDLVSGKIGVVFKPASNGSIYAAYATAQKPPGSDTFTLNAPTPNATTGVLNINVPSLDPQKAVNIEVGTKWDLLDNTLVVTAAAFDTTNKNDQAVADPTTGEVNQFGEKNVRGVEFGVSGQINPNWQVSAGIAHMDTKVKSAAAAVQQGAQINFSPKLTFTSWTTYKLPMGVTLGGGARYVDSQMTQVNNGTVAITGLPKIDSYWVADFMAAYEINKNVSLQLNVTNVTDKDYITSVNNGRSRLALGAERAYSLSANLQF
jgi:catecholate siderophore receptor